MNKTLILLLLLLTGCGVAGTRVMTAEAPPHPITVDARDAAGTHVWSELYLPGGEPYGYGTYTYVLVPRDIKIASPEVQARASALYKAILSSTPGVSEQDNKKYTNVFLIPDVDPRPLKVEHGLSLAISLTESFRRTFPADLATRMDGPGPYLVTVPAPVSKITPALISEDEHRPVLVADLSHTNPAMMAEVVREYKKQVWRGDERNLFYSLKITLGNILANADDHLHLLELPLKRILGLT